MTDLATIAAQLTTVLHEVRQISRRLDALDARPEPEAVAETRAATIEAELHERAAEAGITIGPGSTIGEYDAAQLLGRGAGTLRNWRYAASPLPYSRLGGRIAYAIADLAAFLAERE